MSMHKAMLIIFIVLISISSFAFADTISNYVVPASMPLNQTITATGLYDANGVKDGIKCSFYLLDLNGILVYHASDQFTNTSGRFAMNPKTLQEPLFVRGETYTLHTECGTATADANFLVGQKQDLVSAGGWGIYPAGIQLDMMWWQEYGYSVVFIIVFAIIFIGMLLYAIRNLL